MDIPFNGLVIGDVVTASSFIDGWFFLAKITRFLNIASLVTARCFYLTEMTRETV